MTDNTPTPGELANQLDGLLTELTPEQWRTCERVRVLMPDVIAALRQAENRTCKHGWRGSVPEDGEQIVTPCPSCGQRSLFIGTGGHLTCGNFVCREPGVERAVAALRESEDANAK